MEELRHQRLALPANGCPLFTRIRRILDAKSPRRPLSLGSIGTVILASSLLCCASWQDVEAPLRDRAAFAKKMAQVKVGMTRAKVIELLGKPDDVETRADKMISTSHTKQILGYGNGRNRKQFVRDGKVSLRVTDGTHLSFPTLGCVYFDGDDRVQYVFGGRPFPGLALKEARLRDLLELLDEASPYRIGPYTPRTIIDIANALLPLGKKVALDVVEEYLRVRSPYGTQGEQGLFLVLRVLFEVPSGGHHPRMHVGAAYPSEPRDKKLFPRFPIALVGDIPYLVILGYQLAGEAEPLQNHVAHFRKHGVLRKKPLRPAKDQAGFDALAAKVRQHLKEPDRVIAHLKTQHRSTTGQDVQSK